VYVVKALEAVPGIGKVRARRFLEELGIGEQARVCELSAMQRDRVIERASSHS
jgi:ribosomal protein S13